ncbi:lasso peptide biosynthesis B2 protein [Amycolatopsis mediterranei]|uniref:lasso peptide biosynthesis B2 protein n=1 Tax=Amycolatopsis mediterranei TaxID=33910 RepID=UPI00341B7F85
MSEPQLIIRPQTKLGPRLRGAGTTAALAARLLSFLPPRRLNQVLTRLSRSARPATYDEAAAARDAVNTVSLACRAREGCLPRSIATALLCRMSGTWPRWRTGVRRLPPFEAHAWVEVDGRMVGESYPTDYFSALITVDTN